MADPIPPSVIIISGPNGAGKSTAAPHLLKGELAVSEFVNADVIARGLSAFEPERVAMAAGRIMLRRLDELAEQRTTFAFETTLASKSFAPWVVRLKESGYLFHLVYLWLPSAQMAIGRVESRVQQQGHHVPDEIVQRRYKRGLANFFQLFMPIATTWKMYYNADASGPRLIAAGGEKLDLEVLLPLIWNQIKTEAGHE
jgi:predicted ABC-type ATPase